VASGLKGIVSQNYAKNNAHAKIQGVQHGHMIFKIYHISFKN
jgi:hypothetical protein